MTNFVNDLWGKSGEVPAAKAEEASEGGMRFLIRKEKAKSVRSVPLPRFATADVEDMSPLFTLEETKILDANGKIHDVVEFCIRVMRSRQHVLTIRFQK